MTVLAKIQAWLEDRRVEAMTRRFGGVQRCPWCRQWAQDGDTWQFVTWDRDEMIDRLTCGVCAGTSLWKWEVGFIYVGALSPPKAEKPTWDVYDVEGARLRPAEPATGEHPKTPEGEG